MALNSDQYMALADEDARAAEAATLDNVRERCRRSEAVWRNLATRAARGEVMRANAAAEKAACADEVN